MKIQRFVTTLAIGVLLAASVRGASAGPTALTMPDGVRAGTTDTAYAWAGNPVYFWGRVIWDPAEVQSGTYVLNCGNGTAPVSGTVTNINEIGRSCTYSAGGTYFASLSVTQDGSSTGDGAGGTSLAETRIDVQIASDTSTQINLAIERGLKYMYDRYVALGKTGLINDGACGYNSCNGQTASAVLAFENRGHTPALDENADGVIDATDRDLLEHQTIYAQLVHLALGYIQARLSTETISAQTACDYPNHNSVAVNPDVNGNGIGYTDGDTRYNRDGYTLSQLIMAFVGAGKPDGNALTLDAPDIPAWAGPATGRTFKAMVQDLVEFYYFGQMDDGTGSWCGGWRYYANYGDSDNSPAQWPALSIDEAVIQWGIPLPGWVTAANHNWTNYSQYMVAGDYYGRFAYQPWNWQTGLAMTGAGAAQLFLQNRAPGDTSVDAALNWMGCNWGVSADMYSAYSVAKSMRMARNPAAPTTRKTINTLTCAGTGATHNWNDDLNSYLVSTQNTNGGWTLWYTSYIYSTAWAVEILTPALTGQPPVANAGGPYSTPAGQSVVLDGCASYHEDPAKFLTQYKWDFNNDGTFDYVSPACTATAPGSFYPETGHNYDVTVRLEVVDNVGDVDDGLGTVHVLTGDANVAPVAKPGGPYLAAVNAPFTLDASASYDPNTITCKTIVKYEWDLDGNGSYEIDAGASPTHTTSIDHPYNGQIGLRVTDDCGLSGTASTPAQIFITDLQVSRYTNIVATRKSKYVWEYTADMCLKNLGNGDAANTTATLFQVPSNVTIVDSTISYGTVPAGGTETCAVADTFTIRVDRTVGTPASDLKWRIHYIDQGGQGVDQDVIAPWF